MSLNSFLDMSDKKQMETCSKMMSEIRGIQKMASKIYDLSRKIHEKTETASNHHLEILGLEKNCISSKSQPVVSEVINIDEKDNDSEKPGERERLEGEPANKKQKTKE